MNVRLAHRSRPPSVALTRLDAVAVPATTYEPSHVAKSSCDG